MEDFARDVFGEAVAIEAVGGHGVVSVGDMDDAGVEGDVVSGEAVGVAGAVVIFVMETDDGEIVDEDAGAFEDANADGGVGFDDGALDIGEAAVFEQDPVGNADLADVMEKGTDTDSFYFIFEEPVFPG